VGADFPPGFEIIAAAVVGAMIGSFLNVCILRWGSEPKQSVVTPRSRCPRCGRGLAWYDNIPVISWLVLRARCRGCGEPISVQYPLIELAAAGIWAYMAWRYGVSLEALRGAVFGTILLGIAMTDAREYIIPHEFSIGGTVIAIALSAWPEPEAVLLSLEGALVGAGSVLLIGELSELAVGQEAMGGGDCALMGMIGAFLGWEAVVPVLLIGAVISTALFFVSALRPSQPLPQSVPEAELPLAGGFDPGASPDPRRFRWGMVGKLIALGAVPILILVISVGLHVADDVLGGVFHGLLAAGIAYYASFLLPARFDQQRWVRVRGLLAAAIGLGLGAGLEIPRLVIALVLGSAVLAYARRITLVPSPDTTEGLESQGYLPFGVGLAIAAGILQLSGAMPLVRDVILEYGRILRLA
jgi:leader peptidase (prepilin peptidase)/N-methyltransferase